MGFIGHVGLVHRSPAYTRALGFIEHVGLVHRSSGSEKGYRPDTQAFSLVSGI